MKKVVIGMSGGVDSSVAALILQQQGYEVIGLFMRNWDSSINNDINGNPNLNNNICPQEEDYNDALKVCNRLGITLHRVDFIKEYWDYVFTYFLDELKAGRTPNPDVMCNKYIKFDCFIKEARKLGADFIATGHYAICENNHLYKAYDKTKDQSYFLAYLSEKQLENVLFPLGKMTKKEVRQIALDNNLEVAIKKDSTGICFIGERHFKEFLTNYLPNQEGDIVDFETKKKVGVHVGLMYYTIGQRRGLNLGGNKSKYFVVGKNILKNILYVAFDDEEALLYSDSCLVEKVNLINGNRKEDVTAKFRYRSVDVKVKLTYLDSGEVIVSYPELVKAVTPGQICVFYDNEECLGSGIIKEVYRQGKKVHLYNNL